MTIAAAIQMNSTAIVNENLTAAALLIEKAITQNAQLIVLPENFAIMGRDEKQKLSVAEALGAGPIQEFLAEQARRHQIWIVGGTIPLKTKDAQRVRAACLVFNAKGEQVARYDKLHLFDVSVVPGQEEYRESSTIEPGDKLVVLDTPIGRLGVAVCYDVRFPELFRYFLQQDVEVIVLPAAFTEKTGMAHWEILLRARAIENLSYVIAAAQTGEHASGRKTYGHSMIIEPWGSIVSELENDQGVVTAEINLKHLYEMRKRIPVTEHKRINIVSL